MIQISNQDRDFIVRYIEEMNQNRRNETNRDYNLQRMANNIAKKLKRKKKYGQKVIVLQSLCYL